MGDMTTQELVDELSASLGNRTDISDTRYIRWLNWAQLDLCGYHRKRVFPPKRFHELEGKAILNLELVEGSFASGASGDNKFRLTGSPAVDVEDYYNDYIIKVSSYDETAAGQSTPDDLLDQERLITKYLPVSGNNEGTVSADWDVNPDEFTSYQMSSRFVKLDEVLNLSPITKLWAIERLENAETGAALEHVEWQDIIGIAYTSMGTAGKFSHRGIELMLDAAPNTDLLLRMYYYKYPTLLNSSDMTATTDLPAFWDEVVVLGAVYRGFEKLMEPDRAEQARNAYEEEARNRQDSRQIEEGYMNNRGIKVRLG